MIRQDRSPAGRPQPTNPNVDPETGRYQIYEPPFAQVLSRSPFLGTSHALNRYIADRYARPLEAIRHLDDVALGDGVIPIAVSYVGIHLYYRLIARGKGLECRIPSQFIHSDDLELYKAIVAKFEEAENPQSYFMYRYCQFLVWRYSA